MRVITSTLPASNEAGLDLAGEFLSAEKTRALGALGLHMVQGRRGTRG